VLEFYEWYNSTTSPRRLVRVRRDQNLLKLTFPPSFGSERERTHWIDLEIGIASSRDALDALLKIGIPENLVEIIKKAYERVYVQNDTKMVIRLGYSNKDEYHMSVKAPLREIIPLDLNYYYFLIQKAWHASESEVSFVLEVKDTIKLVKYLEEEDGEIKEVVRALALGDVVRHLKTRNKLELLKNRIDELLRLLTDEGINKFGHDYVFKLDEDYYVITTGCLTEWFTVRNGKAYLNNSSRRVDPKRVKNVLQFVNNFLKPRVREVCEILGIPMLV